MSVLLNVRVDEKLKKQAQAVTKQMGMSLSTAVTVLLTKLVQERKLEAQAPLTENGFTEEFEQGVLDAMKETEGDVVCETSEDLDNFFASLNSAE